VTFFNTKDTKDTEGRLVALILCVRYVLSGEEH